MNRPDVVGIGEAMVLMQAPEGDLLAGARSYDVHVAGAELNACAAVASLGGAAIYLTRLGNDPFASQIQTAAGDLHVVIDAEIDLTRPTGVFFKDLTVTDERRVFYYRAGSAASALSESDADRAMDLHPRSVLVSGLTAALGDTPARMLRRVAERVAKTDSWLVVDANLRPTLGNLDVSMRTIHEILPQTRILVLGRDEGELLFGHSDVAGIMRAALDEGAAEVVVKDGAEGSHWMDEGGSPQHLPSIATDVVDTVGAGDAFTGGYLWARLKGIDARRAAVLGSWLAAGVVATPGDSAGLPTADDASRFVTELLAQA
ncbi:sugar kinase [Glaciihabitans sp. UYNi722]|uniref:sugar kinase n=1 Tax=Glaciihabitans sp. UYNi722 TaxID=3156344 RepID=UPI003395522F